MVAIYQDATECLIQFNFQGKGETATKDVCDVYGESKNKCASLMSSKNLQELQKGGCSPPMKESCTKGLEAAFTSSKLFETLGSSYSGNLMPDICVDTTTTEKMDACYAFIIDKFSNKSVMLDPSKIRNMESILKTEKMAESTTTNSNVFRRRYLASSTVIPDSQDVNDPKLSPVTTAARADSSINITIDGSSDTSYPKIEAQVTSLNSMAETASKAASNANGNLLRFTFSLLFLGILTIFA